MGTDTELLKRLDSLSEGIQIIDFEWKYVYVNHSMCKQAGFLKSELIGFTLMEKLPAIENTPVFEMLKKTMDDRQPRCLENEFVFPDGTLRWLDIRTESAEQGIFVSSLDITKYKESELKIARSKRLYAFLSQINQNIIHVNDEDGLFAKSCQIAVEFGQFKMAWIGLFNHRNQQMELACQSGVAESDLKLFKNIATHDYVRQLTILETDSTHISTALSATFVQWKPFAADHGISYAISIPLSKMGKIIGTFNIYSDRESFSDADEIMLLKEAGNDISFALDKFENARKHKEATASLARSEKQFRHTLDNMIEGAQINDYDWKYLYVNDALLRVVPYTAEELIGHSALKLFPGIKNSAFFEVANRCMVERASHTFETEFFFPNGSIGYYEIKMTPIPEGLFILSVDRTEQRKSKENLLKINRLYAFLSAINQNIVHSEDEQELLDKTCEIAIEVGKFELAWIGFENKSKTMIHIKSALGNNNVFSPNFEAYSRLDFSIPEWKNTPAGQTLQTGKSTVTNDIRNNTQLSPWNAELSANGIQSLISLPIKKFGKTIGVFGIHSTLENFFDAQEITLLEEAADDISYALEHFENEHVHKETQSLLLKNERRFRALIERSPDMKTLTTLEGNVIYGSPSITKVLGYNPQEFINLPIIDFIHPEDIQYFAATRREILTEEGKTAPFELRCMHQEGYWVWCAGTLTNMLHESGVNAVVANFMNISERKKTELELEKQNKALIKTNNELDRFVYSVSHDLRSPITSILGLATFIETESQESNTLKHIEMICDSVKRMDNFIKNIVSYSRNNRTSPEIEAIDVEKILNQAIHSIQKDNRHGNEIAFNVEVTQLQPFFSDRLSFITIIENLISNAVKFQKNDQAGKQVSITGTIDKELLQLKISDNGTGIPKMYQEKIFDMFFRVSGKVDGAGIGLYIVKEIVEKLEGTIQVSSQAHIGTDFIITLKNLNHG